MHKLLTLDERLEEEVFVILILLVCVYALKLLVQSEILSWTRRSSCRLAYVLMYADGTFLFGLSIADRFTSI